MAAMCSPAAGQKAVTSSRLATNATSGPRTNLIGANRGRLGANALSLPKTNRILRSAEFKQIYQSGVRMTSKYFTAFWLPATSADSAVRFGFTVPRALGKAVVRNRLKRRLREAVRCHLDGLPNIGSVVFNPRRNVLEAPFLDLCQEVGRILSRCKPQ